MTETSPLSANHPGGVGSSSSFIPERGLDQTSHGEQVGPPDDCFEIRHSEDAADHFKSNRARTQPRSRPSTIRIPKQEIETRAAENREGQPSRRALHDNRVAIRAVIHRNSLHALKERLRHEKVAGKRIYEELKSLEEPQITSVTGQSNETVQSPKFPIDKGLQAVLSIKKLRSGLGTDTDLITHWLYSRLWLCRILSTLVYSNCRRLQTAGLAYDILSVLVPAESWSDHVPCAVSLRPIQISDIEALSSKCTSCICDLFRSGPHNLSERPDSQLLIECFLEVQEGSGKLFASIDSNVFSRFKTAVQLGQEINDLYAGNCTSNDHLRSLFAMCQETCQTLDLVLLAYEGAHVSDLDHSSTSITDISLLNRGQPFLKEDSGSPITYARRLPLKCLAPPLENRDVWVFTDTMTNVPQNLYLKTDIETFTDVWGPVWGVTDQDEPNKIARYNVGLGSILPSSFDPVVHPALAINERLCHWSGEFDFIDDIGRSIVEGVATT